MRVRIRHNGIQVSEDSKEQALRRIRFALGRFSNNLRSVGVELTGGNRPPGGPIKECRIEVNTKSGSPVVIQELDPDIDVAIARATERAGRAVARRQLSVR